jgi:hypothetical protein
MQEIGEVKEILMYIQYHNFKYTSTTKTKRSQSHESSIQLGKKGCSRVGAQRLQQFHCLSLSKLDLGLEEVYLLINAGVEREGRDDVAECWD